MTDFFRPIENLVNGRCLATFERMPETAKIEVLLKTGLGALAGLVAGIALSILIHPLTAIIFVPLAFWVGAAYTFAYSTTYWSLSSRINNYVDSAILNVAKTDPKAACEAYQLKNDIKSFFGY